MAMYYTIASRGSRYGTSAGSARKKVERTPSDRAIRPRRGRLARQIADCRRPETPMRVYVRRAIYFSTQYRNVNYRLTLRAARSGSGPRPAGQGPPRSRHGGTRPQFHVRYTEHSKSAYRLRGVVISARPDATGRSGRLSSCHFAFSARRLPLDEGALLWAGYTSLLSRQLRHGLRMVSQMIASPHGHSRHVSPRRARGRLQAPISFWSPRRLHPPSFPLIVAEASRQRCRSVLPLRGAWYNAHRGLGRLASVFPG